MAHVSQPPGMVERVVKLVLFDLCFLGGQTVTNPFILFLASVVLHGDMRDVTVL